jgi:hypothetical protein
MANILPESLVAANCTPGTEWFRFQKAVPTGRIWTAKHDSVTLPAWLGISGIRHSIDLGADEGGYNGDHEIYGYRMPI